MSYLSGKNYLSPLKWQRSPVNRHVCDVIIFYDKRHFELSTGDAIMNSTVSFFAFCLKYAQYVIRKFLKRSVLYLQSYHILYHFF